MATSVMAKSSSQSSMSQGVSDYTPVTYQPPGYAPQPGQPTMVQPGPYAYPPQYHPGYGPSQQSSHTSNTTVVVQQPVASTRSGPREWNSGLCGCFEDIGTCLCTMMCPEYTAYKIARDLHENECVACCLPGGLLALRVKLRTQENINGSICNDFCALAYCPLCALCQMARELDYVNHPSNSRPM